MTITGKRMIFAQLALAAVFALTLAASLQAQVSDLYVSTIATEATGSQTAVAINGLSFDLPAATATQQWALVTLNMPDLYLKGTPSSGALGGEVSLVLSGVTTVATGQISADVVGAGTTGRKPMTIVVKISLLPGIQSVAAYWNGVRGSQIHSDTFASLSAILTQD